jgi:hypothetical protein
MDAAKIAEIEDYAKNVLRAKLPDAGNLSARHALALVAEVRRLEGEIDGWHASATTAHDELLRVMAERDRLRAALGEIIQGMSVGHWAGALAAAALAGPGGEGGGA